MRTALVTGITGQDGSYLAELLLEKGYRVIGVVRRTSTTSFERIGHLLDRIELASADMLDQHSLVDAVRAAKPDEVYNLAAHSFPQGSWSQPVLTAESAGLGATRLLEAVRAAAPNARYYQASTAEIFADTAVSPQDESTPAAPRTPYGVAKAYGHWITRTYRESLGVFAVSGILFNHESPRRGVEFVTRKITDAAARIKLGLQVTLALGDLSARRDWGYAPDYVDAMWRMLQRDEPEDLVIGTGEVHSVGEFCDAAFRALGLDYRDHVVQDDRFVRPRERVQLVANPTRARTTLGWSPTVSFERLVEIMVEADLRRLSERQ